MKYCDFSTLFKLETCRKSLSSCIALVEEASAAIEILEHQLEAEKDEHEKEVKKFEKTVLQYEKEFNLLSEDSINNNVKPKEKVGHLLFFDIIKRCLY